MRVNGCQWSWHCAFVRWLDKGKLLDAICYAVLAALTVYFHFLFGVTLVVHGADIHLRLLQPGGPKQLPPGVRLGLRPGLVGSFGALASCGFR